MRELENRVGNLEGRMEAIEITLGRIAQLQLENQRQLNTLSNKVEGLTSNTQRILTNFGESSERNTAATEVIRDAVGRLTRNAEADRSEFRNFGERIQSMVERLDALVNYLIKQNEK